MGASARPGNDTGETGKSTVSYVRRESADRRTEVKRSRTGTDAGVHARAMVANIFLDVEMTPLEIRDYMNRYLPDDIAVNEVREASERFHARYNAVGKTYQYTCYAGEVKTIFDRKYVTSLEKMPDVKAMQEAAEYLKGKHDFASFCTNPRMKKSTVRIVDQIDIIMRKGYIYFTFHGTDSFRIWSECW